MSKASIAQEPSMDEILASIRRIIETGDEKSAALTTRPPSRETGLRSVAGFGLPVSAVPPEDGVAEERPATDASHADDPLTAQLESELAASWGDARAEDSGSAQPSKPADDHAALAAEAEAGGAPAAERSWPTYPGLPAYGSEPAPSQSSIHEHDASQGASAHDARDETAFASVAESPFVPANTDRPEARMGVESEARSFGFEETAERLLSETSGALVASSFEELAQAIRAGELRSIESMAQDMLRPMLREWLDDNLPHMVERLVREEIERMARGGRR